MNHRDGLRLRELKGCSPLVHDLCHREDAQGEDDETNDAPPPHGGVLQNTCVFHAARGDPGYSSADLRAIGMKTNASEKEMVYLAPAYEGCKSTRVQPQTGAGNRVPRSPWSASCGVFAYP